MLDLPQSSTPVLSPPSADVLSKISNAAAELMAGGGCPSGRQADICKSLCTIPLLIGDSDMELRGRYKYDLLGDRVLIIILVQEKMLVALTLLPSQIISLALQQIEQDSRLQFLPSLHKRMLRVHVSSHYSL